MDFTGRVLLDKYRIEQKIGEGGMGYVYRAKNIQNGKDVAIKILKEELVPEKYLSSQIQKRDSCQQL
jgi:eukaryotic-like serine/threonine-protein kinase